MNQNGHKDGVPIPILGPKQKVRMPAAVAGLVRRLDEDGTFEGEACRMPDGTMGALTKRTDYIDATELLELIRQVVREEIAAVNQG